MSQRLTDLYGDLRPEDLPPPGLAEAREALAAFERVNVENAALTCGGTAALMSALTVARIRGSRSHVLCPRPHFPGYPGIAALCGLHVSYYDLPRATEDKAWLRRMAVLINNVKPSAVIVNSPHNPTGAVLADRSLVSLTELASSQGGVVVLDEAFAGITLDGERRSPLGLRPGLVRVGSFNKRFPAMADHRLGYVLAEPGWTNDIALAHRTLALGAAVSSQRALVELLAQDPRRQMRQLCDEVREHALLAMLRLGRCRHLHPIMPRAGVFMIVGLEGGECTRFAATLRQWTGVWCAAAPSFGAAGQSWIRLRLALPRRDLERYCNAIVDVAERTLGMPLAEELVS